VAFVFTRAIAYAPLVPFAVAATIGIVVDRYSEISSMSWLVLAASGILLGILAARKNPRLAMAGLWICSGGLAGAHHHSWRNDFPANDIGQLAAIEPKLVRVRGTLVEEPVFRKRGPANVLVGRPASESTVTVFDVREVEFGTNWAPSSGRIRLSVEGQLTGLHIGDEVEIVGLLSQPSGPMNPGEWDYPSRLRDDRIRAELRVPHSQSAVVRLNPGPWGFNRVLSSFRSWGQRGIIQTLDPPESSIANALLLGDPAAMSADEWDRFVRTGVIHVLVISGQHLVILGAFFWFVLRILGVRRKPAAIIVAVALLGYAQMTGGRPSAMRAAIMVCCLSGGVLLRRRPLHANTFALAWMIVLGLNPTDLFSQGFQLSFLCVAVLYWIIPRWIQPRKLTPLEQLIDESRTMPERTIRSAIRLIGRAYLASLILCIATAPPIMYWQNIVSPAGVLVGPLAILLTTWALFTGFMLILLWPLTPIASPFAWLTTQSLYLCDQLIMQAEKIPFGYLYVGSLPLWWLVGYYAIGGIWMLINVPERSRAVPEFIRPRYFLAILACWSILGLLVGLARPKPDELRVTFLAVDHGCCAVIEAPDGRVLLYDAGATVGPNVTKRRIAPFLWSRGIRRIDEVFISHADLDHFNGLPALLDRFPVGQITLTPSFSEKSGGGVRMALESFASRGVAIRTARQGDQFTTGDLVIDVLHPPGDGPVGVENVRSMVLLLRHRGHTILLTGDLEEAGLDQVMATPAPAIDVLMAPHHGSGKNAETLAKWAKPRLVVSSQGRTDAGKAEAVYTKMGVPYWSTWPDGAVTIRSHSTGLIAESFATSKRTVVRSGSGE